MTNLRPLAGATLLALACASLAHGQTVRSVTREQATAEALAHAPRVLLARSDTALASARLLDSRLFLDPQLGLSYSKSTPRYHVDLDLPLDLPWLRQKRIAAAEFGRAGSRWRLAFEREATALDADTSYTRALTAHEQSRLSVRNAVDADSLLRIALARRDAGDASELDVQLATIFAGQQHNRAAIDSLAAVDALLALQAAMGLPNGDVVLIPTDSLAPPPALAPTAGGTPLLVAAATADLHAAMATTSFARRGWLGSPSLIAGFESGDPSDPGMLPTVGISLPLPLLNRNRGAVATAEAERGRADVALRAARIEMATAQGRAIRALQTALGQLARDSALLVAADRVRGMSLTAYREGAAPLSSVLEAQRSARDVRSQYLDDLAGAWIARGVVILLSATDLTSQP